MKRKFKHLYIYTGVFLYIIILKKNKMKTRPTYILVIIANNYVYTTFWRTIHFKGKIVLNDYNFEIIDTAKSSAFDLFSSPIKSHCRVNKITTSQNISDNIIFELLERIDNKYYTTDNIEIILNDIVQEKETK